MRHRLEQSFFSKKFVLSSSYFLLSVILFVCQKEAMILQIIDAKDRIVEDTSIDSFISGFELAWQLSMELNNYKNERLASCRTGRLGARFTSEKEEPK